MPGVQEPLPPGDRHGLDEPRGRRAAGRPAYGAAARDRLRRRRQQEDRPPGLKPLEVAVAVTLVLAVLGGLATAGWQLYRRENPDRTPAPVAQESPEAPPPPTDESFRLSSLPS